MDKKTVSGLILIFIILMLYSYLNKPSKEEIAERQRIQDSVALVQQKNIDTAKKVINIQKNINAPEKTNSAQVEKTENNSDLLGVFSNSGQGEEKFYSIENDLVKIKISNKGGKIISAVLKRYQTHDSLPLELIEKNSSNFGFEFFANNRYINTENLFFQPENINSDNILKLSGSDSLNFSLRLYTNNDESSNKSYIEYLYTFKGDDYMFDLSVNFIGLNNVISSNTNYLNLNWGVNLLQQEKTVSKYNGATIYYKYFNDDVKYLSETKDDDESLKTKIKWLSYKQQFFTSTLIADKNFINADIKTTTKEEHQERYLRSMTSSIGVPFNPMRENNVKMHFYYGPNKYKTLRKYHLDLEQQIPLGWSFFLMHWINRYAVIPVFNFLEGFNLNYGIIILLLTILLKIVLFPIAYKTYSSSAKMRVLKPEIDEISKKYPKKEDAMKKQQATMALYKKVGASPMAGCLPMLLQFPILIAMFRFFPAAFELRQQSFLWATDLSSYDSIWNFPNGFSIPFYGDHVSLFTLLMTVSTIIYTKINNDMMGSSQTQMPGMKAMTYLMPIMFLGIFNNYSAGLSYYYFLANVITFGQMFFIRRYIDEDKLRKKLLANQKKPKTKSKFQKRLEEMSKQQKRR